MMYFFNFQKVLYCEYNPKETPITDILVLIIYIRLHKEIKV